MSIAPDGHLVFRGPEAMSTEAAEAFAREIRGAGEEAAGIR